MELETCAHFCSWCFPCRFWVQWLFVRACWHSPQGNDFSRSYHLPLKNHYGEVCDLPREELSSSAWANPNSSECLMFQIQDDQSTLMSFLLDGPVSTASSQHITNVEVRHTLNCIENHKVLIFLCILLPDENLHMLKLSHVWWHPPASAAALLEDLVQFLN